MTASHAEIEYEVVKQHERDFLERYGRADPLPYEPPKRNHIGYEFSPFTRQPTGGYMLNDRPLALNSVIEVFDDSDSSHGTWHRCKVVMRGRTMFAHDGNGYNVTISPNMKARWATKIQSARFLKSLEPPEQDTPPFSVWFDPDNNKFAIVIGGTHKVVQYATSQADSTDLIRIYNIVYNVVKTMEKRQ